MPPNTHVPIDPGGTRLVLAAITDPASARFGLPRPDIEAALAGAPAEAPVILLSHRPLDPARHAHAGGRPAVVRAHPRRAGAGPALGQRWANGGYVSGLYPADAMRLYVSNGAGLWSGFPMRLGKRSEITEFILRLPQVPE